MVSRSALFAFGVLQSGFAEYVLDADGLVGDGCSFGVGTPDEGSCALGLLQRSVRKTNKHSLATTSFQNTDSASVTPKPTPMATPESPWPEFEAGGVWDFHVRDTPVKIVGWTGMGMVMNTHALETYYPQCTYSELPHTAKDRSVWHKHTTDIGEYVIRDPDTDISDADVVLFYLPYFMRTNILPSKKHPGQLWIATCGEAMERPETDMDCSQALDKEFMKHFDGFASYRGSADFLDPHVEIFPAYQDPPDAEMLKTELPGWTNFGAMGHELVTLALSDCDSSERNEWITKVVEQFKRRDRSSALVSYGECFHNSEEAGKTCKQNTKKWYDPWSNRCSSRSLKLVAENRVEPWYVTEKVWDALWEGSVPIYFGPPEVKFLVPPGSILYYADFESPEALVDYILDFDERKLAAARSWRNLPESEWGNFTKTRMYGHQTLLPRFCVAGAKAKQALAAESTKSAENREAAEDEEVEEESEADEDKEVEENSEAAEDTSADWHSIADENAAVEEASEADEDEAVEEESEAADVSAAETVADKDSEAASADVFAAFTASGRNGRGTAETAKAAEAETDEAEKGATVEHAIEMSFEAGFKAGYEAGAEKEHRGAAVGGGAKK